MKNPKTTEHTPETANVKPEKSKTAIRGKYFNQLQRGTNLVILDPALMPHFPDSASVNRALHAFLAIGNTVKSAATNKRRRPATQSNDFDPRIGTRSKQLAG